MSEQSSYGIVDRDVIPLLVNPKDFGVTRERLDAFWSRYGEFCDGATLRIGQQEFHLNSPQNIAAAIQALFPDTQY